MTTTLLGALLVGLSLGLMGSGGSILTVPILTFLVGQPEKVAIAGSLAVVGFIALLGAIPYVFRGLVHWRSVVLFGIPGMIGSYGGASISEFISGEVQLGLFAITAMVAAFFMMRSPALSAKSHGERSIWKIMLDGFLVGAFTGLVGVGGGFLIVPALVVLGGLPMHVAVGTSLVLISLKSATGFWKYAELLPSLGYELDWNLLLIFSVVGVVGSFAGHIIHRRLPQMVLRRSFAVLLIVVGGGVLLANTLG